jgi:hypothetical protein
MTQWCVQVLACTLSIRSSSAARTLIVFIAISHGAATAVVAQSPSARWGRGVGGVDDEYGWSVASDAARHIYVTGYFSALAAFGPTNLTSHGGHEIFLAKYDHHGNFLWATRAGGATNDQGRAVVTSSSGDVYLTGHFRANGTFGETNILSAGAEDIFLAKLNSSGQWRWTSTAGGANTDEGRSVAVDADGNCYVAGIFFGSSTFGTNAVMSRGQSDIVLAKANDQGQWLWAKSFGGPGFDESRGVAVAQDGCYVTGYFNGTVDFAGTNLTTRGGSDIFLAKFNTNGELLWVLQGGGNDADEGHGLALDSVGDLYLTGGFSGAASVFGTNVTAQGFPGSMDAFLAKLDSGGKVVWLERGTGASQDSGNAVAIDLEGNSYVSGLFVGSATFGSQRLTSTSGQADVFFVKYSPRGELLWAFQSGGPAYMSGNSVAVDSEGSAYGTGFYRSQTSFGGLTLTNSSSGRDAFVVRVDGPPRLRVGRSGEQFVVAWPAWASGYQLQSSVGLGGPDSWAAVTNVALINGEQRQVSPGAAGQRRLFRLRSP